MTVRAHYDRVPHMSQYDIPPEVMNQDDIYNESVMVLGINNIFMIVFTYAEFILSTEIC